MTQRYDKLRQELLAFHPEESHQPCRDPEKIANRDRMAKILDDYAAANPGASACALRRKLYQVAAENFYPVVFRNSPFYFETGINGGWSTIGIGRWLAQHNDYLKQQVPEAARQRFFAMNRSRFALCCGFFVDSIHHLPPFTAVLRKGFQGLCEDARAAAANARTDDERDFIQAAIAGFEAIPVIGERFARRAEALLASADDPEQRRFLTMIATHARRSPWLPPATFYEGLNMFWFCREVFGELDGLSCFSIGHPDAMLHDLYLQDLAAGRLTRDEAYDLICRFLLHGDCHENSFSPVVQGNDHEMEIPLTLGGCDGDGKEVFNDITRMCLQAHRELDLVFPKLHCRFSAASSSEYLQLLASDIYAGRGVISGFNDDAFLRTLQGAGVPLADARRYVCTGCWDGNVDGAGDTDTANYFSLARVLEATIYQDLEVEQAVDFHFRPIDGAGSFAEVRDIVYGNVIGLMKKMLADYTEYGKLYAKIAPAPFFSACQDGCLRTLKDIYAGGARYNFRIVTLAFYANLLDALLAIKKLCFDDQICTLPRLLDAVRGNWQNAEDLRLAVLHAPHWGDDSEDATALARFFLDNIYDEIKSLRNNRGGGYHLASWIYREFRFWGEKTRALPDGRRDGDYLAQGLNPSFLHADNITTMINAISRVDHTRFFASNTNFVLGRQHASPEIIEALFRSFAQHGMHLLQLNCFSRDDLLDAQKHPERHQSLIVRMCGFSARFVVLSPEWQREVLSRTIY